MAGIGFSIRRLVERDDLYGLARAFGGAALASSGPWLFTILALFAINLLHDVGEIRGDLIQFRVILVYNFAASLVLSSPVFMVVTRYLADRIYLKDVTDVPAVLIGNLGLLYLLHLPVAIGFYLIYVDLDLSVRLVAILDLFLITTIWLLGVFLTALKDYNSVSRAYGLGMVLAVLGTWWLESVWGLFGMLLGFGLGMAVAVFVLIARILSEYNYRFGNPFASFGHYRRYWDLALGGIFYNMAIWVDKLIMWYAPEAILLPSKMRYFPEYDSSMFYAYVSIVPMLAIFILSVETDFFQRYQRFYEDILKHASLRTIRENHAKIWHCLSYHCRNSLVIQLVVTTLALLAAPKLFEWFNISFRQIGIFRLGLLGSFFHILMLAQMIILCYFENRRAVMWQQLFFLVSCTVLTFASQYMGWSWYGYGYFLSALMTFIITTLYLMSHVRDLPYHAFITNNRSVRS